MTQLATEADASQQVGESCLIAKRNLFSYVCGTTGAEGTFFATARSVRELSLEGCPHKDCQRSFGMGIGKCLYTIIME
ncbi:MAG: hypothetical protein UY41_C0008G0010 [Candidatus Moranbacteria bacterium GW2011_GWE1_49_15]|nr:MAG: hypothetical protein UX75_C0008G0005 [Candidatus Moranbacteria bacterium GW2011_GWE2_47_10]KKW07178.1 MAG: hypothetical protein UY41_C0008G0010 [Candidatus Moranbacteria bacterium GW2011_GWE1_49_15]HBP01324.1 hypothetical protein [Candidatus Moranbacteria bacterium]